MNVQPVTPNFTGSVIYRISKDYTQNTHIKNLDGQMMNILREQKLPAIIQNRHIDVSFDKQYQQKEMRLFKDTLKDAGIKLKLLI